MAGSRRQIKNLKTQLKTQCIFSLRASEQQAAMFARQASQRISTQGLTALFGSGGGADDEEDDPFSFSTARAPAAAATPAAPKVRPPAAARGRARAPPPPPPIPR